jgi:hypothetical protein
MTDPAASYSTDKIGFAAYLCWKEIKLLGVAVKNRNRAIFTFEIAQDHVDELELEFTRSDMARYFEAFKYLRERTIKGS